MHTSTFAFSPVASVERQPVSPSRGALLGLTACVIIMVYAMPINQTWFVSMQEHYATPIEEMESGAVSGNIGRQAGFALLGLFGVLGLLRAERTSLRVRGILGVFCAMYVLWCGASIMWSSEPGISFRRFGLLVCEALAAAAFARHVSPKQMVYVVLGCTLAWLGLGVLAELSLGTFRPWEGEYRFSGILHPNEMGMQCAISVMAAVYLLPLAGLRLRPVICAAILGASTLLYLTGSRTAIAALAVCLAWGWVGAAVAQRRYIRVAALGWLVVLAALSLQTRLLLVLENTSTIGRADSDMSSLTGRIPLWEQLSYFIAARPWAGYGYGGFWTPDHIREMSDRLSWSISSSHSSYVELALSVGIIGATICVVGFLLALARSLRLEARAPEKGYAFLAMILMCTLVSGFTETTFGIAGARPFFAMCAVAVLAFREERASAEFAPNNRANDLHARRHAPRQVSTVEV
jgi:exopolysaccharide production protein ExoQ